VLEIELPLQLCVPAILYVPGIPVGTEFVPGTARKHITLTISKSCDTRNAN